MNIHQKVIQGLYSDGVRMTFFGGACSKIYMNRRPAVYCFGDIPRPVCHVLTSVTHFLHPIFLLFPLNEIG